MGGDLHLLGGVEVEVVRLALHGTNTSVLHGAKRIWSASRSRHKQIYTYCEEQPLQLLAVALRVLNGVVRELVLLVELLGEVEEDRGGLPDGEAVVGDSGDAAVGADLEEPVGLDLVVDLADVGIADAQLNDSGTPSQRLAVNMCEGLYSLVFRTTVGSLRRCRLSTGNTARCGVRTLSSSRRIAGTHPLGVGAVKSWRPLLYSVVIVVKVRLAEERDARVSRDGLKERRERLLRAASII